MIRLLGPDDRPALEAFLLAHADSSLFLRGNVCAGGMVFEGRPLQAVYVGLVEAGAVHAVAAHCWNDFVLVQAPTELAAVVCAVVERSGRPVAGMSGPWTQVCDARRALGLHDRPAAFDSKDVLMALELAALVRPPLVDDPEVVCRRTRADDLELAVEWRIAYAIEELRATDGARLHAEARADMERHHREGSSWILEHAGRPVSFSAFNASLPDVVQIGGVFTPPALRSRGYARAVVAGSLVAAAAAGVGRSVLFTGVENPAAQRAYRALGFRPVGDYGLLRF